jgi:hypothetical protein
VLVRLRIGAFGVLLACGPDSITCDSSDHTATSLTLLSDSAVTGTDNRELDVSVSYSIHKHYFSFAVLAASTKAATVAEPPSLR